MSEGNDEKTNAAIVDAGSVVDSRALVERSQVTTGLKYDEYRPVLRKDFFFTCAYCTTSEVEAFAVPFAIDHYEPRNARPELEHDYTNLMYACQPCNSRKGDRYPPPAARENGARFFRPDVDAYDNHFERNGVRIDPKSTVGDFTITALTLNRQGLRRIREFRERLSNCDRHVAEGIRGLRRVQIDQLPAEIRGQVLKKINQAVALADAHAEAIDAQLRKAAQSPLLDDDSEEAKEAKERIAKLKRYETLFPGSWRAPRKSDKP